MDEIRSWWEVPCIAHYCYLFRNAFKLPPFEIEELEDALLVDYTPDPSSLLVEIYSIFLTGICGKQVTEENWSFMLKLHLEWRVDFLKESFNPLAGDQEYKNLTTRQKVELLHRLCHWRLELDDIGDLLKGLEALDLRLEPVGKDGQGHVYWYFYGTRLYREPVENYKQRARAKAPVTSTATPNSRSSSSRSKKAAKSNKAAEPEATEENEGGKEEWELLCSTSEEWEELTESFRGSKQSYERSLFKVLNDELLPDILQMITAKEKKYKKKLLMDAPRRQSSRIALKTEEHQAALEREKQREERRRIELEELRVQEEQAAEDRRKAEEEARKKAEEEAEMLEKVRKQEEEKWEMALSGELSGPRKAAIGAAGETTATTANPDAVEAERDEELYTSMYKVCSDIRKHEDGWVFVDPVTDDIAPGYSDVIKEPMDIVTIEQKLSDSKYSSLKEFVDDFNLIFDNCYEYNGADSEYAEVADNVKKYFKKLCKRYFNEVYLKEKEEKERTPSPEHEKALKDLEEDESDSDDSSGSDSDTSEFGVSKKSKRNQKGKLGEKGQQPGMDPSIPPGMWPRGVGRGAVGPNGLTINAGTLENLQRLAPHGNYPPRMPHGIPPLPPNAPPHVQQEYYAKLHMMQQRQRYMHEMMRRQQQHHHQQQQRGGYPRYPPGMEGMSPSHMQHGMPPRPNHPDAYGNMMAPPNYPYPDHMMRPPYPQQPPHPYRGHYPPYHNYPNNPQEHFRMPPPDYNEAAKEWNKGHKGMPPSQGEEDNSIQSPTGRKSRQTSVSSDGMGVKSPLGNATAMQSSHSNSPMDTQAASTAATPQDKEAAKSDHATAEKDESDAGSVDHGARPSSEPGSTDAAPSARSSVSQPSETGTKQQQTQPDNEAYKRGVEAAYKYHQEQMRKKQQQQQQQQQQVPPPVYSPGHTTGDMNYGKKPQHQQQMMTAKQQESYMQWRQHQEAMWRSQQMGMPTPPPMGSPYSRNAPGPMYDNHAYHNLEGAEQPDAYKQQQQQHEYHQQMQQQQQYMMNRRYMEDMYRQQRYGHPGMHAGSSPYPYGHHPGYGRPPYHSPMDKPNPEGNPMPPAGSPHLKADATAPGEDIPDYTDSLRKYAMGLTGSTDKSVENISKSDKDNKEDNVSSSSSSNSKEEKSNNEKDQENVKSSDDGNSEKDDKTENKKLSSEVESTAADSETKPSSEEKENTPVSDEAKKDVTKSVSGNVTSPSSSFPAADSTTHDGSTPDPTPNPMSRPSSHPSVGAAQNGHKGHYPPSMYPSQNAYGGWDGMPMHQMGYNRGMYPPSPMGRPENMEEYERYRMYHEQMMAMRQMPPQDPYHGMGMHQGMSPYEMEQYHHYGMMQGRMGAGPPHPQMARGGYHQGEGEQQHYQKQGLSQEEMKRYQMKQEQHMAAVQHQMRTYHHHQQQQHHHGSPYGPPPMGGASSMPPDYPGMASPSSANAASMAGAQHQKMSAPLNPQQQGMLKQPSTAMPDNTAELNNDTQEPASNKGTEEPPSKKAKLDC